MRAAIVSVGLVAAGCGVGEAPPCTTCDPVFIQVAAGGGFACALDTLGQLWCWGDNSHHQIAASDEPHFDRATPVGTSRWDTIATGGGHVCGLRDGALACWGANDRAQVSIAISGDVAEPTAIAPDGGPGTWQTVAAGDQYSCAIGEGRLFCWGAGDVGELGTGMTNDDKPTEVVPAITDWIAVGTGARHTCAISGSQGLYCWGDNSHGELGDGTQFVHYAPEPIALPGAAAVAIGLHSTCAVTGAGALYCWGEADHGELGDPAMIAPTGILTQPTPASALTGWTLVASAEQSSCALRGDEVWCWGSAKAGGIGNGVWASEGQLVQVATGASDLAVGWNAAFEDSATDAGDLDLACMIRDGAVACWGDDRFGQLGQGAATAQRTPVEVVGGAVWTSVVVGAAHACGISQGVVACWGSTERGQITGVERGLVTPCTPGTICDAGSPVAIEGGADVLALGGGHTCALRSGTITCWGDNASGQAGRVPSPPIAPHAISGQWSALFAPRGDGACGVLGAATWCWGQVIDEHAPAHEASLSGAREIVLGAGFGCALDATGALACFGDNSTLAFGNGGAGTCGDATCNAGETAASCPGDCAAPLSALGRSYLAISAGWSRPFACGIRLDGQLECWGDNAYGQAGEPDPDTGVLDPVPVPFVLPGLAACTAISAGGDHVCALCSGEISCWGDDRHGELGAGAISRDPVTTPRTLAVALAPGDAWAELGAGIGFTCARTVLGHAYCWGTSSHGALGTGATAANLPVAVTHASAH